MPRIKIEDKHTYFNYADRIDGNNRYNAITSVTGVFHTHRPYWPVQGTDENNRIGRKIQTQSIVHEGYLTMPLTTDEGQTYFTIPTILDGWNGYMQDLVARIQPDNYEFPTAKTMFSIPIRHLWVEFYDDEFERGTTADKAVYLQDWFKNLTVQIGANNQQIPSIQTKMLRESTPFTGDFKILKDKIYWLSPSKPVVHFKETIKYKRSLSFDAQGADPTNSHIYSLWIGPTQPLFDYNNPGFSAWMNNGEENPAPPFVCANIQANMKLKYIDV